MCGNFAPHHINPTTSFSQYSDGLLDPIREELKDLSLSEQDPMLSVVLAEMLGQTFDDDATGNDLLDALLDQFQDSLGLDLEKDVLDWMTGEISLALLPTDFQAISEDPLGSAVQMAALVQFDPKKRSDVAHAVDLTLLFLKEQLGVRSQRLLFEGREGVVLDLQELDGIANYEPGFLILDDELLIASTKDSLGSVISIVESQEGSLAQDSEYSV